MYKKMSILSLIGLVIVLDCLITYKFYTSRNFNLKKGNIFISYNSITKADVLHQKFILQNVPDKVQRPLY